MLHSEIWDQGSGYRVLASGLRDEGMGVGLWVSLGFQLLVPQVIRWFL